MVVINNYPLTHHEGLGGPGGSGGPDGPGGGNSCPGGHGCPAGLCRSGITACQRLTNFTCDKNRIRIDV